MSALALSGQVAARYGGASRWSRGYVRGKLLADPATNAVLRLAAAAGGLGHVVDLGCGRGQIGLALLTAGLAESLIGLDLDAGKLVEARQAAAGLPARFEAADLAMATVPAGDTVLAFDVLYQLPAPAQHRLLAQMAQAARRRVVIRAFDPACGWRAKIGLAMEHAGRTLRGGTTAIRPLPLAAIAAPFRAAGFSTRTLPCWGWTPLPNVMLVAER